MLKADSLIGQVIGGYQLTLKLSAHTTQHIYMAKSVSTTDASHYVTFKLVSNRPLILPSDQEAFLQEVGLFRQLQHPHILPILDYGVTQNLPYIIIPHNAW